MELYLIDPLLQNLEDLFKYKPSLISHVKEEVQVVQQELMYLNDFLKDTAAQQIVNQEHEDLAASIKTVACKAEYIIDSIVVGHDQVLCFKLWLADLVEEIKVVKTRVSDIRSKKNFEIGAPSIATTSSSSGELSQSNAPMTDEFFGFEDEAAALRERLTGGPTRLQVISIVGLAGLGKTSLANKLYNDSSINYYFDVRAWCTISQVYRKRKLLLDILSSTNVTLKRLVDDITDQQLANELRKYLLGKRYLIVMDDVWNIEVWNDLRNCFASDCKTGSRILFTSRLKEVALQADSNCIIVEPRFLSNSNSWDLLKKKVFKEESCPEYLVDVGKKIAKNCKGLPHSIVVVGGLLAETEKRRDWWEKVAESTSAHIVREEESMKILELSYDNLPNHLKACFLYLGTFPEDHHIPVWKLILLWIGEGFVFRTRHKRLEDVAEDYLMDLISRSLVVVSKRRSNGGIKACRLHDLQLEFCIRKAKDIGFLQQISDDDAEKNYCPALLIPSSYTPHRLLLHSRKVNQLSRDSRIRSLITTADVELKDGDFSFNYENFELLKVLELRMPWFQEGIDLRGVGQLVLLRYLRLRGDFYSIPASICNLWNLDTLILFGTYDEVEIPSEILSMGKLRHLIVKQSAYLNLPLPEQANLKNSLPLEQLQTISRANLLRPPGSWKNFLKRLPNLRKVKSRSISIWDPFDLCSPCPNLQCLTRLESLNLYRAGGPYDPHCKICNLPSSLKKLTLSHYLLSWSKMSIIATLLPKLEVLKLLDHAFIGQRWHVKEGLFPKLKFLKLKGLDLEHWNASSEHFPKLERLVLDECESLWSIPFDLGAIPTLMLIEVKRCHAIVEDSAIEIHEYQREEMGNEQVKVIIYPPLGYDSVIKSRETKKTLR